MIVSSINYHIFINTIWDGGDNIYSLEEGNSAPQEALNNFLEEIIATKTHEAEEQKQHQFREQKLNEKAQKKEEEAYEEKLTIARNIFDWAESFLYNNELQEKLESLSTFARHSQGTWMHTGVWGHDFTKTGNESGAWARLYVQGEPGNAALYYWAGYKWMNTGPTWNITTPEQLATMISLRYLKELANKIESGQIYNTIQSNLKGAL